MLSGSPTFAAPGRPAPLTYVLAPYTRGATQFRFLDIADNPYSEAFRRTFRYQTGQVTVTFPGAETDVLRGRLTARGLKPNFAYQIKLEGRPPEPSPPDPGPADVLHWTNRRIGEAGRWWCVEESCNTWDEPTVDGYHKGHTLWGYLLVDFFVTDARGNAEHDFRVDSSFHVLWKDSQYPPSTTDGRMRRFTVRGDASYGYAGPIPRTTVGIYPEREYGRAEAGTLRLPPGRYSCRILLTEESFHSWGSEGDGLFGGYWAHCLSAEDVTFTIR